VRVENPEHVQRGVVRATLDGERVDPARIPLVDDGRTHEVKVTMGAAGAAPRGARSAARAALPR